MKHLKRVFRAFILIKFFLDDQRLITALNTVLRWLPSFFSLSKGLNARFNFFELLSLFSCAENIGDTFFMRTRLRFVLKLWRCVGLFWSLWLRKVAIVY